MIKWCKTKQTSTQTGCPTPKMSSCSKHPPHPSSQTHHHKTATKTAAETTEITATTAKIEE